MSVDLTLQDYLGWYSVPTRLESGTPPGLSDGVNWTQNQPNYPLVWGERYSTLNSEQYYLQVLGTTLIHDTWFSVLSLLPEHKHNGERYDLDLSPTHILFENLLKGYFCWNSEYIHYSKWCLRECVWNIFN